MSKIYAVAGRPVFRSRSPVMFNTAFRELALDSVYTRLCAASAEEVMATARQIGLDGLNVTSPFKADIMGLLDEVDGDASRAGAVNTVVRKDGGYTGYNTDIAGVAGAVLTSGVDLRGEKAVVLGAGGAARAAAVALLSLGARVLLMNRTIEKAQEAAAKLGCEALPFSRAKEALKGARLLISAVSSNGRLISPSLLTRKLTVLDANYAVPGALVRDASKAGCALIDGREWLLAQAAPTFALFTGQPAPVETMRRVLWKKRRDGRRNIALIGFMGTGKSAVAEQLGALADMPVIDIDKRIEEKAGASIAEIFDRNGEEGFRRMEQAQIDELTFVSDHVVSCGGGAVLNRSNVRVLRNNCLSVWLWAGVRTALDRIGGTGTRPLLNGEDREAAAEALLGTRLFHYAAVSDLLISTEGRDPHDLAERIWDEIRHTFSD